MPKFARHQLIWLVLIFIVLLFILAPHAGLTEAVRQVLNWAIAVISQFINGR